MRSIFLALCILAALAAVSRGDEPRARVEFRDKANVSSRIVLLSDVAQITSADAALAERLSNTELVAAPTLGKLRTLRRRELIDHLQLNGFDLKQIDFSGAAMIEIGNGVARTAAAEEAPTGGRLNAAQRRVKQVVTSYLRASNSDLRRATIDVECSPACAAAASTSAASVSVVSAENVSPTEYRVQLAIGARGAVEEFAITARIEDTRRVVVASRALRAGAILAASDLRLAAPSSDTDEAMAASDINELIGKEVIRPIGADQVIPLDQIAAPRLVRKGELVEVTARAGGVRVTTQAIAQQDGGLGETISLEPVDAKAKPGQKNKEVIRAQVVAQGQAMVDAGGRAAPAARLGAAPGRLPRR